MNGKVKKKWIRALRSGRFKQAHDSLRTEDGFCCLGVLCDLYRQETKRGEWRDDIENGFVFHPSARAKSADTTLPPSVMRWAGLREDDPRVGDSDSHLSGVNDSGRTFAQIAAMIQADL